MEGDFKGFSQETINFFTGLENNNTKDWFEEKRPVFDQYVLPEAQTFVLSMGHKLRQYAPEIVAIPKIDKAIFRLYRDVRFSKDKSPYKTHLGIFLWEGEGKKLDNPGFYFQLNSRSIFFGVGMHIMPKNVLEKYRDAVVDDKQGPALRKIIDKISRKNDAYQFGWKHYKRIPRGYDENHPNADLLLHNGLGFQIETVHPVTIHSENFLDHCYQIFSDMAPVHIWIKEMLRK